ncbi:unnamed protein product [Clonostachys rhizophaga]|uniref:Uncharacterized protein n=1 Tax=Clonostachys rhizophaga TaxID=160324 RepID=A0A9N9VDK1_9HYPO|nr:unnamed protein product [Clonostachys rhizophaga]
MAKDGIPVFGLSSREALITICDYRHVLLLFSSYLVRNESDFKVKDLLGAAIYEGVKPMIVSEITRVDDVINDVGGGDKPGVLNRLGGKPWKIRSKWRCRMKEQLIFALEKSPFEW